MTDDIRRGIYVHVPFCERRCHYCDFNVHLLAGADVDGYLHALRREAQLLAQDAAAGITFDTLYVGGGTPTALPSSRLEALIGAVTDHLALKSGAEITVEANPGTLSPAKLAALRRAGANRISLGAQAFQDHHLERLGRIHRSRHIGQSVAMAREAGFANVSLDLMFGLPHQTLAEWQESLEQALALEPDHLSCYSLIVEEGTLFGDLYAQGRLALPEHDTEADMFEATIRILTGAGFAHYEVSNFARPGKESQHNLIYWENGEWFGLGPGAHSQWQGKRFAHVREPAQYQRLLLEEGRLPVATEETLTVAMQMEDTLILGLRLTEGISLARFRRRFGVPVDEVFGRALAPSRAAGWVETVGDRLRLTRAGFMVANRVLVDIVGAAGEASA